MPNAWQNATTMELMGFVKDIADFLTAHCIESVQTDWLDCWTSDGQLGPKPGCMHDVQPWTWIM